MEQYHKIKNKHSDAVLFFRMGDFYEMFYEDAKIAARVLGLTLTSRAHGKSSDVPLAGFPHHALDNYLARMIKAGYRVAICEQTEDPKKAKKAEKKSAECSDTKAKSECGDAKKADCEKKCDGDK